MSGTTTLYVGQIRRLLLQLLLLPSQARKSIESASVICGLSASVGAWRAGRCMTDIPRVPGNSAGGQYDHIAMKLAGQSAPSDPGMQVRVVDRAVLMHSLLVNDTVWCYENRFTAVQMTRCSESSLFWSTNGKHKPRLL